jgi:hypothetical protein
MMWRMMMTSKQASENELKDSIKKAVAEASTILKETLAGEEKTVIVVPVVVVVSNCFINR